MKLRIEFRDKALFLAGVYEVDLKPEAADLIRRSQRSMDEPFKVRLQFIEEALLGEMNISSLVPNSE